MADKYRVAMDGDWKTFAARKGQELADVDLKTADGQPLPADVVKVFVSRGVLTPVKASAAQASPAEPAPEPTE